MWQKYNRLFTQHSHILLFKFSLGYMLLYKVKRYAKYICTLILSVLYLSACSTVSVEQKTSRQLVNNQQENIANKNRLSSQTISSLRSYGINENACLAQFDICLSQIKDATLLEPEQKVFALVAELHLAKAIQIRDSATCQIHFQRDPIDPNYANAPIPLQTKLHQQAIEKACNTTYLTHLLAAIRYSYTYLFYDVLQDGDNKISAPNLKIFSNNTLVQTRDIYNAATSRLIKLVYAGSQGQFKNFEGINVHYSDYQDNSLVNESSPFYLSPPLDSLTQSHSANEALSTVQGQEDSIDNQFEWMQLSINDNSKVPQSDNLTTLKVNLPKESEYIDNIALDHSATSALYSSYDLSFSGLNSISQREGIGVSFVTLLTNRHTTSVIDFIDPNKKFNNNEAAEDRIYHTGNLLLTGVVTPKGNSVKSVLANNDFEINLYNPYHVNSVKVLGLDFTLAGNFSASYGLWLTENQLQSVGRLNMLARQQSMILPQLYMLEPYDPNKRVIIMIHGLASSPATWVGVTNDIFNDSTLRDNYQVWQIFYPTNIPMLENRYQIQKLIETAYKQVDPTASHPASHHSVIIAHSMGAVIARMLVSNDDLNKELYKLNDLEVDVQLSKLIHDSFTKEDMDNHLQLHQIKSVDSVVFISAPLRGTNYADRWFTLALRRIIQLPLGFVQTVTGNLSSIATKGELTENPLGALYLQNGASQLSNHSSFMKLTSDIHIADNVTYDSIIANQDPDIVQGLAQSSLTQTKIDLSQYNPANQTFVSAETFKGISDQSILVNDLKLSSDNHEELNNYVESNNIESNNDLKFNNSYNKNTNAAIATIEVKGEIDPSLTQNITDGIVPYQSAHLDGAASETIITGNHGIQESAQAILVLRKILRRQLDKYPINPQ